MADPLQLDLIAQRRVLYAEQFAFLEQNFTGATLKLQVRVNRDTTGTPLIERATGVGLSIAYAGTDTVANHVAAGRLLGSGPDSIYELTNPATGQPYAPTDNLLLSMVYISFDVGSLAAVGFTTELGGDVVRPYDLILTPAVGDAFVLMSGNLIVRAGVTIP